MGKIEVPKYCLVSLLFFISIVTTDFLFVYNENGSFSDYYDHLSFPKIIFITILCLLAFIFKGGLGRKD